MNQAAREEIVEASEDAQRLRWLTGFGGSAGSAVVLADKAAIFVDGRYTVQVRDQVEERLFEYRGVPKDSPAAWLARNAQEGAKIGYDAWLATPGWVRSTTAALEKVGAKLVAVEGNPIDAVWQDQPAQSDAAARVHADEHAGRNAQDKRQAIADWLTEEKLDAVVLSALDSVGWAFNIRGADIAHTPVAMAFALVSQDGTAQLFIDENKVSPELKQHLGNAVSIRPRAEFETALGEVGDKRIALDPEYGVAAIAQALEAGGAKVVETRDPTILPRAIKNAAEIDGHRDAQARDGAAVSRFLAWVEAEAPSGEIDEPTAAVKLLEFLVSEEAQKFYAEVNQEFPVRPGVPSSEIRPITMKKDDDAFSTVTPCRCTVSGSSAVAWLSLFCTCTCATSGSVPDSKVRVIEAVPAEVEDDDM